jgi:hypothetical protein
MQSFVASSLHILLFRVVYQGGWEAGYVACMGEMRNTCIFVWRTRPLWTLRRRKENGINYIVEKGWRELKWLRVGASGRLLWTRWWTFDFYKSGELLDQLSDYQLFKKDSTLCSWSWTGGLNQAARWLCFFGTLQRTFGRLFMPGWRLLCCCSSGWAGCGARALGGPPALSRVSPHLQQQQQPAPTHENRAFGETSRATAARSVPVQVLAHVPAASTASTVDCSLQSSRAVRTKNRASAWWRRRSPKRRIVTPYRHG